MFKLLIIFVWMKNLIERISAQNSKTVHEIFRLPSVTRERRMRKVSNPTDWRKNKHWSGKRHYFITRELSISYCSSCRLRRLRLVEGRDRRNWGKMRLSRVPMDRPPMLDRSELAWAIVWKDFWSFYVMIMEKRELFSNNKITFLVLRKYWRYRLVNT